MSVINAAQTTQIAQSAQSNQTTGSQQTESGSTQFVGEEFNNFLKLLTAQLRHQDPLSPLDSTQFVEQLASFSTLEQQVQSNTSLKSMASMIGDLHSMFASEWLGQTVTVESSWVPYSGDPVEFAFDAPNEATAAVLTIANSSGEAIYSDRLKIDDESKSWDGRFSNGGAAASGEIYQFGIDLYAGDTFLGTVAPQVLTTVTDVGTENGELRIGTSSSLSGDLGQVRRVTE